MESNLPTPIRAIYENDHKSDFSLNDKLNPFFLRFDKDGNGTMEYAVSINRRDTRESGILIVDPHANASYVLGAGVTFYGGQDFAWMNAWRVLSQEEIKTLADKSIKFSITGEALEVLKLEAASAMIYWDGSNWQWYQLGD